MTRRSRASRYGRTTSDRNGYGYGFAPYVPVAERRAAAEREVRAAAKKGITYSPVAIAGRAIATTHWGRAFCDHLEDHCDAANRLPRGRTYVRNGSVIHLETSRCKVSAKVFGSSLYAVAIDFAALPDVRWTRIREASTGRIASLLDLLAGRLPDDVMSALANPDDGLFPRSKEMTFRCSCPDGVAMCKHVAAVLYGLAARADADPGMLFELRGVDPRMLVSATSLADVVSGPTSGPQLADDEDLGALFGIALDLDPSPATAAIEPAMKKAAGTKVAAKKAAATKVAGTKVAAKKVAGTKVAAKKAAAKKAPEKKADSSREGRATTKVRDATGFEKTAKRLQKPAPNPARKGRASG